MRASLPVAGAAFAVLCAIAQAGATGWSSPQTIWGSHDDPSELAVSYAPGGRAVASWRWIGAAVNEPVLHRSMAVRPAGGARFGPERRLPDGAVDGPHVYGSDRVLVATRFERVDRRTGATAATRLAVRFGDLRGRFGAPHVVQTDDLPVSEVRLAVNRRGGAVLAWTTYRDELHGTLHASVRPPAGDFGRPVRLGESSLGSISAAMGEGGDVLVAWRDHAVLTRFKRRGSPAFGPVDRVRSEPSGGASLYTSVDANGNARVGWFAQTVASGGTIGVPAIQLARRPANGRRFERALLLARGRAAGGRQPGTAVAFAKGPPGMTGVAWTSYEPVPGSDRGVLVVRVALVKASGAFEVQELARSPVDEPGGRVSLTFAGDGGAVVAWTARTRTPPQRGRAYVSRRPANGVWSAPELVAEAASPTAIVASYPLRGGPLTLLFDSMPAGASRARVQVVVAAA
jgi:hypothetical protein